MTQSDSLHITLNSRCNNRCLFCMETLISTLRLPAGRQLMALLEKGRSSTDAVLFTGPEPTVAPGLIDAIALARKLGYRTIRLVTNGRLLSHPRYAEQLLSAGVNELSVSLHGSCPSVHDALTRTPGSFSQTHAGCLNISRLKACFPFLWNILLTLTQQNAGEIQHFFALVHSFKSVDAIVINSLIPQANASRHLDRLCPSLKNIIRDFRKGVAAFQGASGVDLKKRYRLTLLGLPLCVLKGCEHFSNRYEAILMGSLNENIRIEKRPRFPRQHRPACRKCCYFPSCEGVWSKYIQKRGWSDFVQQKRIACVSQYPNKNNVRDSSCLPTVSDL